MKSLVGSLLGALAFIPLPVTEAGVKEVKVTISDRDNACKVDVHPARIKVYQKKRDLLVWTIANDCAKREVRICRTSANPTSPAPFDENCKSDPKYAVIGTQFTMYVSEATVSCHIDWDYIDAEFNFYVLAGEGTLECPRGSELALEIDP